MSSTYHVNGAKRPARPNFLRSVLSASICAALAVPAYADSFWTGEVDGTFSADQNWQSGLVPALANESVYFAGDHLLGNSVTAINYDLTGATYNQLAFNYINPVQHSTQTANFALTGSVLNFSGSYPAITSASGTNSIANNIQADQLSVSSQSSSSLTLDGNITLTGGSNTTSYGGYGVSYRNANLAFSADVGGSLVINGDITDIPLSGTRDPLDWRNRFISFNGAGVQFNGNLDIYTDYANTSVEIIGSTIFGSVAANQIASKSAVISSAATVRTADFIATGDTYVSAAINLDDHTFFATTDFSDPAAVDFVNTNSDAKYLSSMVSVMGDRDTGSPGNLTLAGDGVITTTHLEAPIPALTGDFSPRIELHDGRLNLNNNSQVVTDRIADNINVHFGNAGVLALQGHATTAVNEHIGKLVVGEDHISRSGGSTIIFEDSAAHGGASIELSRNSSLTASELMIADGRWLNVSSALGSSLGGAAASDPKLMIATAPTLSNGLVDGVLLNRQEFATYDAVNGVVSATSADNIRLDVATSLPVTGTPQVMNSLALNFDGQMGGSDAIELTSGRLLANGNVNIAPSVNFGAQQGRVYAFGDVDFTGGAVANNGLQVSGDQEFVEGYQNTTINTRTVSFSGGVALNGPLGIDSATVQIATGQSANLAGGLLNNAVLDNAGAIENTAHLDAQGSNRIINSGSLNNNGGEIGYVPGVSNHYSYSAAIVENSGSLTNQATGYMRATLNNNGGSFMNDNAEFVGSITNTNGGVITNQAGGLIRASLYNDNATITNEAGSSWASYGDINNRNGGSITNSGTMEAHYTVLDGNVYAADFNVDSTSSLHNMGTITLEGGDLVIANGAGFTAGTINLTEICNWSGGGEYCYGGNLIVQQDNYTFSGSLVGNTAVYRNAGYIRGNASLNSNSGTVLGKVYFYGNNRSNSGTLDGQISAGVITNSGSMSGEITATNITNNYGGSIWASTSGYATTGVSSLGTVVNYGTVGTSDRGASISRLVNHGTVSNNGSMQIASLDNKTSGNINNSGNMSFNNVSDVNAGTITNHVDANLNLNSRFTNTGAIDNAGGTMTVNDVLRNDGSITNAGTVNVTETGRINGTGTYTQDAGQTIVNGTIVGDVNVNGGLLGGSGRITGNVVVNGGDVGPGNSPGKLVVGGDFTLSENGTLHLEVNGLLDGEYDQLQVSGLFDLRGAVVFELGATMDVNLFTTEFHLGNFFLSGNPANHWDAENLDLFANASFSTRFFDGTVTALDLADINAVPVPAAVWLFGSGLLGLIGFSRRKKAA